MSILKNITQFEKIQSQAITLENPTGEKDKAAMLSNELGPSRKGHGAIPLTSGEETVIADITGTGIIRHMWMTIHGRAEFSSFVLRDLILRIYWDGSDSPAVESPLRDFFCNGFGECCEVSSLPIVVNPIGSFNSYFEMPFQTSTKITIENLHPKDMSSFFYTINYALVDELGEDSLYFHASWRRERTTKLQEDYKLIDRLKGQGYRMGTYLALTCLERYWQGEGESKFYIDGDSEYPVATLTSSGDYFGGAWAFHEYDESGRPHAKNYSTAFLGYPYQSNRDATRNRFETGKLNAVYAFGDDAMSRYGLYRQHPQGPIYFTEDLPVTLQQIGNDDVRLFERQDDAANVAYWYLTEVSGNIKHHFTDRERLPR